MAEIRTIRTALVSVYDKGGLSPVLARLHESGVRFLSTGGTQKFIESLGYPCQAVEEITTYPSILGGRVKTLHPKIFGGILARRGLTQDKEQMRQYDIPEIDLVIVDLYPFEETVASGASLADVVEKIDIGGISLIRAAAKNFNDVAVVPTREDYDSLLALMERRGGACTSLEDRRRMAVRAFGVSSRYDAAIQAYLSSTAANVTADDNDTADGNR